MRAGRALCLTVLGMAVAGGASAQPAPEAAIQGSGIVRVCEPDGQNLDSDGDSYGHQGDDYLATPTSGFRTSFSCIGQTQSFNVFTTADPKGSDLLGFRMVSQTSIAVTVEPQYTEVYGSSEITSPVCLTSPDSRGQAKVLIRAKASRSLPIDCMDDFAGTGGGVACSGVRGRFQGLGATGFVNAAGSFQIPGTFADLTEPNNARWTEIVNMLPFTIPNTPGSYIIGALSGSLITRVMHAPEGRAFGDLRFYVEVPAGVERVDCPAPDTGRTPRARAEAPLAVLPRPAWFVAAGDAIPEDFTLAISPPTGAIAFNQQFDIALMAATNGATLTGITGSIDGLNVTGPLAACLRPTSLLTGVQGGILTCRGISGGFLAGIFGLGAHTFSVSLTLSDGRTISDSVTWSIRQ
jgi:hypothetical protein